LGWALEVEGHSWSPVYRAQTSTLYDGTAGIALFLARLYSFTQDPVQRFTAIGALNQALNGAASIPESMRTSFYSGSVGIASTAIQLGKIFEDDRMIRRGLSDLEQYARLGPNPLLDILGGSAGTIQALLQTRRQFDAPQLMELALQHGDLLITSATRTDLGWSWDTLPGQTDAHLLGYGHGAAGIGCALLELWAEIGDERYRQAALESFRYERAYFDAGHHNWPDLRRLSDYVPTNGQPVFSLAWCHGGPGIGLARLRALELLEDRETAADLDEALKVTAAACSKVSFPASGALCLCHGFGGNADLLILASDIRGQLEWRRIAEILGHRAISDLRPNDLPWPCGVNGAGETPNLMLGLAGIGYFFLRLYDSAAVPSILLVRSPAMATADEATSDDSLPEAVPA
jgi:lantibiotic modifying enzyme